MVMRFSSSAGLLGLALLGCGASAPASKPPPSSAGEASTPPQRFAPGRAEPERRARLAALAPDLDRLFESKLVETGGTALAVGVVLEGELVYGRAFGVRDVESRAPADVDTVFRIGSLTKNVTALAVLRLRDEGKLSLDEPVTTYVPELGVIEPPTWDSPPITARLLLTNAAGLAYDDLWGAASFGLDTARLMQVLRAGVGFSNAPGTKTALSNLGWALLGLIVERVSGVPYREYVTRSVLRPLGMSSTVWEPGAVPAARLAVGYRRERGALVPEPRSSAGAFAPAGGLYTSLRDYARFVAFNLTAYPPRDAPEAGPVRRSTIREMHAGQRWIRWSDRGMPPVQRSDDGFRLLVGDGFGAQNVTSCAEEGRVQHAGHEPGYFASSLLLPRPRLAVFTLATTAAVGARSYADALAILRGAGLLEAPAVAVSPALRAARSAVEGLLERWAPGAFQAAFDAHSAKYAWNAGLPARFARLGQDHGGCRAEKPLQADDAFRGRWHMSCERGSIDFEVLLAPTSSPRIQALLWTERFPLDEDVQGLAEVLVQSFGHGLTDRSSEYLAPTLDFPRTSSALRLLGEENGDCEIERAEVESKHAPPAPETQTVVLALSCTRRPMQLSFTLDPATRKITSLSSNVPHTVDGTCWL